MTHAYETLEESQENLLYRKLNSSIKKLMGQLKELDNLVFSSGARELLLSLVYAGRAFSAQNVPFLGEILMEVF